MASLLRGPAGGSVVALGLTLGAVALLVDDASADPILLLDERIITVSLSDSGAGGGNENVSDSPSTPYAPFDSEIAASSGQISGTAAQTSGAIGPHGGSFSLSASGEVGSGANASGAAGSEFHYRFRLDQAFHYVVSGRGTSFGSHIRDVPGSGNTSYFSAFDIVAGSGTLDPGDYQFQASVHVSFGPGDSRAGSARGAFSLHENLDVLFGGSGAIGGVDAFYDVTGEGSVAGQSVNVVNEQELEELAGPVTFALPGEQTYAWEIDLTGGSLDGNATLVFHYDEGLVADENALSIYHFDNGQWKFLMSFVDPVANTITVQTSGFSPFAIGVVPEPSTVLLLGLGLLGLGVAGRR